RHTRFSRDWSSDVCSSDLIIVFVVFVGKTYELLARYLPHVVDFLNHLNPGHVVGEGQHELVCAGVVVLPLLYSVFSEVVDDCLEIGRASCREGVWIAVVGV